MKMQFKIWNLLIMAVGWGLGPSLIPFFVERIYPKDFLSLHLFSIPPEKLGGWILMMIFGFGVSGFASGLAVNLGSKTIKWKPVIWIALGWTIPLTLGAFFTYLANWLVANNYYNLNHSMFGIIFVLAPLLLLLIAWVVGSYVMGKMIILADDPLRVPGRLKLFVILWGITVLIVGEGCGMMIYLISTMNQNDLFRTYLYTLSIPVAFTGIVCSMITFVLFLNWNKNSSRKNSQNTEK